MTNTSPLYERILSLYKTYYSLKTGKESLLTLISESEVAEQVYNSNAIENSTLSLEETEKILLQIDLDRYVTERELFEAKNLARVIEYIEKNAQNKQLDLEMILFLHKMLIFNIREEIAGRFRQSGEYVRVGTHIAPAPEKVEGLLAQMLTQYRSSIDENIIQRIAKLHLNFEHIHPFVDGNGRIGRIIINYILIKEGFVPVNIKFIDRKTYYEAFREFDETGKTEKMENIVALALTNSYHKRVAYLEGKHIVKLSDYAKTQKTSYSNLLNKAKRQTIPAFLEKGVWKIGVEG